MKEFVSDGFNLLFPKGDIHIDTISATQAVTVIRRIHAHLLVREDVARKSYSLDLK